MPCHNLYKVPEENLVHILLAYLTLEPSMPSNYHFLATHVHTVKNTFLQLF